MRTTLHFWRPDYGSTFEDSDAIEVDLLGLSDDAQWAAEQYAEFYHSERDGWEASWPITFHVAKPDGTFLGAVCVDREARPHFYGKMVPL